MKKIFASLIICSLFVSVMHGQEEEVIVVPKDMTERLTIRPSSVFALYPGIWAPGFKLEWATGIQRFSFGLHARGYLFFFNGGRIEPFMRYYAKRKAPEGLFVQAKLSAALYDANSFLFRGIYCYESTTGVLLCPGDPGYVKFDMWRYMVGPGIAVGYQLLAGKQKRFALDVFGGLQFIFPLNSINRYEEFFLWLMRGFPMETGIRIGWAF